MKKVIYVICGIILAISLFNKMNPNLGKNELQVQIMTILNKKSSNDDIRTAIKKIQSIADSKNVSQSEREHAEFSYYLFRTFNTALSNGERIKMDNMEQVYSLQKYISELTSYGKRGNKIDNIQQKIQELKQIYEQQQRSSENE